MQIAVVGEKAKDLTQMQVKLSHHAREMWAKRVCIAVPEPHELSEILTNSIKVQKQRDLFTEHGTRIKILALYWHPTMNIIFKVDHRTGKVVTVLTPLTLRRRKYGKIETSSWEGDQKTTFE